jgi:hypothetical protein
MTYTMDTINAFCKARDTGECVEVDEELFNYFLEVLPPIHMGYRATVKCSKLASRPEDHGHIQIYADFGFAEGAELVTAFWSSKVDGTRYYAQLTTEMNPHA